MCSTISYAADSHFVPVDDRTSLARQAAWRGTQGDHVAKDDKS